MTATGALQFFSQIGNGLDKPTSSELVVGCKPLGNVMNKFLAPKSNRSAGYMDKLKTDMRLFLRHFGADQSIDRIRSDEIEDLMENGSYISI